MNNIKSIYLFVTLAIFLIAKDSLAQISTIGNEFYVGFMENYFREIQPDIAMIIITANEDSDGYIQQGNTSIPFSIKAGEQFVHEFSEDIIHRTSGEKEKKSAYIYSSGKVAVHAFNHRQRSGDGTVLLPVNALGKDYYVTAHADVFGPGQEPGGNTNFESTLLILAVEDFTEVEIITSTTTVNTIPANAPLYITLNAGETYQIKAVGDLTGSRIRVVNGEEGDCKNIAVFGGNKLTSAGDCGTTGDHLFQQAYPINTWGKSYIHVPFIDRTSGEIVKVLASSNDTEVRVDGNLVGTINAGKFLKLDFGQDQLATIETSKPTAVTALGKSQACNLITSTQSSQGDPSLITYSSTNQRLKSAVFSIFSRVSLERHFINVIVPSGSSGKTILNGQNMGAEFKPVPGNSGFEYAQLAVSEGVNSLSNPEGFIGYAYGSGFIESFAYAIAANLQNVQFETETTYDFEVEGDKIACFEKEGIWKIIPDSPLFNSFIWDFGDGSQEQSGQEVAHTFSEEGIFEVVVLASTGEDGCDNEEEFRFEVDVKKIEGELKGPSSVCPNEEEILYVFENTSNFDRVEWEIEGGIEISKTDSTLLVRWENPTEEGVVRAIPYSDNGCQGEIQEIQVTVSDLFEPDLPEGPVGICGVQTESLAYSVPFPSSENNYNWIIEGGTIQSGQGTEEIQVIWDFNATGRFVNYEVTASSTSQCSGISKKLEVIIYPDFEVNVMETLAPSCPGEANGMIKLEPVGGSGTFNYVWVHDPNLNSEIASDLSSGIYEVKITDLSGCGEVNLSIEIEDLDPLSYSSDIIIQDVSCVDSSDGLFRMKVTGGTAPYEVLGYDSEWDGEFLTVSGLPKGPFAETLIDSRSCTIVVEGEILGPEQLEIRFFEENPGCPGGSDGILEVIPSGGTAPYTVLWENGLTDSRISGLSSGQISVTVTDANGCSVNGTGNVTESKPQVRMPTGFNPKDGPYEPIFNCTITYELLIWDRWGQLVYAGSEGWDGNQFGNPGIPGTFTYKITYEYPLEGEFGTDSMTGFFTLIQ
ncbi:PKD domain-containing protein [Algoriphagus sp. SE2]|uniref:PKD domain-containing protein n=1 Tax=Algoriphagus sp. SE2 TaxID=3141536 RepID=UPI0031CD5A73